MPTSAWRQLWNALHSPPPPQHQAPHCKPHDISTPQRSFQTLKCWSLAATTTPTPFPAPNCTTPTSALGPTPPRSIRRAACTRSHCCPPERFSLAVVPTTLITAPPRNSMTQPPRRGQTLPPWQTPATPTPPHCCPGEMS